VKISRVAVEELVVTSCDAWIRGRASASLIRNAAGSGLMSKQAGIDARSKGPSTKPVVSSDLLLTDLGYGMPAGRFFCPMQRPANLVRIASML